MGKNNPGEQIQVQEMLMDITRAKTTYIHAQIVNLNLDNAYGHYGSKYNPNKHQKRESVLHMHSTTT